MGTSKRSSGRPRVGILTSLVDFSSAYSLTGIILDQARMLQRAGYDYDLLVLKNFKAEDKKRAEAWGLSIRYDLAQVILHDYQPHDPPQDKHYDAGGSFVPSFDDQVKVLVEGDKSGAGYMRVAEGYDVIITHDLMFVSWNVVNNAAIREVIKRKPRLRWVHWAHSGASAPPGNLVYPSELRFSAAERSTYVFLNYAARQDYANQIGTSNDRVKVVYNPKDVRDVFSFCDDTCGFIDRYGLLDHDILQTYAFSTPRWREKGVRQLLKVWGFWKKAGVRARLVLINAHCNQEKDQVHVRTMGDYATACGLVVGDDVVFSSEYARECMSQEEARGDAADERLLHKWSEWRYSIPSDVVRDLTVASNMFMFPSVSECCSLIQAEAAVMGKFMVLNRDFLPMLEFADRSVLSYQFSANNPDSNENYYECVAREIWANLKDSPVFRNTTIARRQTYNRDWIWANQIEPLLYIGFDGEKKAVPRLKPDVQVIGPNRADTVDPASGELQPVVVGGGGEALDGVAALEGRMDRRMGLLESMASGPSK